MVEGEKTADKSDSSDDDTGDEDDRNNDRDASGKKETGKCFMKGIGRMNLVIYGTPDKVRFCC